MNGENTIINHGRVTQFSIMGYETRFSNTRFLTHTTAPVLCKVDADREFDRNTVVYCFSRQNNRHPLLHQRKLIGWSTTKVGKLVLPSRNISLLFSLLSITFIPLSLPLSLSLSLSVIQNQIYRQSISISFLPTTPHYL